MAILQWQKNKNRWRICLWKAVKWEFKKNKPHQRLSISGVERIVRNLGFETNINKVHPHKFRRTFGTNLSEYADITSVQELMGHSSVRTTMLYVASNKNKVRYEHSKLRMSS